MIEFRDVSLHFGAQDVLRQAQLRIAPGERVGVVGANGSGKSTLFALISGEMTPYRGTVICPRDIRLGHVRQQLPVDAGNDSLLDFTISGMSDVHAMETRMDKLTQVLQTDDADSDAAARERRLRELGELETRYDHVGGYSLHSRAEAVLCGLGFQVAQLTQPLAVLSGGWRMRAELARALVMQPDILLLDEPSNYLDLPAIEWLQRFLRDFDGTLLLISHDRYLLQRLTTVTVEIARGEVTRYEGGYSAYVVERRQRIEQQVSAVRNQDRKRQQIERFVERFRSKNTKATQVQSRIKALERMDNLLPPPPETAAVPIRLPLPPPCGHDVMRLENVGLTYDGTRWIFRDVDIEVRRGDRMALVGYNGMGKTSLLRIMAGVRQPSSGRCITGHKVKIGYQPQEFSESVSPSQTVLDAVRQRNAQMPEGRIRSLLGSFGFNGDEVFKTVTKLSGGEKIRLVFACLFVDPPNLLILDEPTTHLDMAGRESLEQALCNYPGSICFVSHDIVFVRRLATAIVAVTERGVERFAGSYDDYQERCKSRATVSGQVVAGNESQIAASPDTNKGIDPKERRRERARNRREISARLRELKRSVTVEERAVDKLEREQHAILDRLARADAATDYAACNRRLYEIAADIERHTLRWEQATEALERAVEDDR